MQDNKLVDLSFEFAKSIVNLVDNIKAPKSSYMIDQLARTGTSVGANIHEAQYKYFRCNRWIAILFFHYTPSTHIGLTVVPLLGILNHLF